MTTDATADPLCALLATSSPERALELLPAAVGRAAGLAARLRGAVQLRSGSNDPFLVDLLAAMGPPAELHERFVATWSDTPALSPMTQQVLEDDVEALIRSWTSIIEVVVDSADAPTTA
ncbi:MAG: hypothetical protein HOV94_40335 [Saccharothrix sp.]|nr:hypothetical protein [Saccharothrix sp.]